MPVLILILLDVSLGDPAKQGKRQRELGVLILILLDVSLGELKDAPLGAIEVSS